MRSDHGGMTRRRFLAAVAGGLAGAGLAARRGLAAAADRPNFVVIFTDDQGYQDIGCFGSPKIRTPNLDRMAAEGMKLTDFYVAGPVCSPSRAALMTGCYPIRAEVTQVLFPGNTNGLAKDKKTVAEVLKARGYATACVGKWHLGHLPEFLPTSRGFDSYYGIPYSNDMSITRGDRKGPPVMRNEEIVEHPADQPNLTRRYTEEAIAFIRANKDHPFFLYLPHTMPHVPLAASEAFRGKSPRGFYGDVIEEIDWSTGEVLKALKEAGVDSRTLVVFTSDNGPWLSKGENGGSALPLRDGKGTTYEGGMREPCLARWPGHIPAGSVCSEMVLSMDLMPTFARLAGADLPGGYALDGKDVWPLLSGQPGAKTPHEAFFFYRGNALEAVRGGKWKLILYAGAEKGEPHRPLELYDLAADIGESKNVAAENADVVARLTALAVAGVKANGGSLGRPAPRQPAPKKKADAG